MVLHLCSRFAGKERGVHTQVKQESWVAIGVGNLGARLISNIQVEAKIYSRTDILLDHGLQRF